MLIVPNTIVLVKTCLIVVTVASKTSENKCSSGGTMNRRLWGLRYHRVCLQQKVELAKVLARFRCECTNFEGESEPLPSRLENCKRIKVVGEHKRSEASRCARGMENQQQP